MNSNIKHPDIDLVDKLRAGLLDDQPGLADTLRRHLMDCATCRRLGDWTWITRLLDAAHPPLDARLAGIRREALSKGGTRRPHRVTAGPLAVAASLAAVFVLAVVLMPPHARTPGGSQARQAVAEPPDLYENIDFYLWLADHHDNAGESSHSVDHAS